MLALAALAVGILIGVSVFVAVRLLLLHRRTGGGPELWLGGMLLLSVGVGYPLRIAANQGSPAWSGTFTAASMLAIGLGFSLLFVFTWRVFRPQATWARVLASAGVITLVGKALHGCFQVHSRGAVDIMDEPLGEVLLETGPLLVAYVWTAWESLRYHKLMRRRVKIGLADAAVSDRFRLWGLMAVCASLGVLLNTVGVLLRVNALESPAILLPSSATGVAQAVFLMLALAPPSFYLSWVRGRAAAPGA